jgi:hypothetical protein
MKVLFDSSEAQVSIASIGEELSSQATEAPVGLLHLIQDRVTRAQLHVGVMLQVLQQLCGINTVMYFTPVLLRMAGFHEKREALLLSCFPAAVNAGGTILGVLTLLLTPTRCAGALLHSSASMLNGATQPTVDEISKHLAVAQIQSRLRRHEVYRKGRQKATITFKHDRCRHHAYPPLHHVSHLRPQPTAPISQQRP